DHAALADADPAGDDDVRPQPAVGADASRALAGEALPGDGPLGVVEAVARVGYEAAVGEHAVLADLDQLLGGEHHAHVQEAALADPHARAPRRGDPDPRLEQHAAPDIEAPFAQRLQHVSVHRPAQQRLAAHELPVDARSVPGQRVALVVAPLLRPQPQLT